MNFITALKAEFFLLRHLRGTLWLLLIPSTAGILRLALAKLSELGSAAQAALAGDGEAVATNGYGFFVDSLSVGLILLYLSMMAYAAYGLAHERDLGTTRHLIIRSVSRTNMVLAKFIALLGLSMLAFALLFVATLVVANSFWELGPVVEDGYELIDVATIHTEISLGLQLALFPLPAAIALGIVFAIIARSAAQAVTLAIGVSVVLSMFGGMLNAVNEYLFIRYQPALIDRSYLNDVAQLVRGFSDVIVEERALQLNRWLPIPQALLLLLVAILIGKRKVL